MQESVRWLMIKNRKSEAHKILLEIARTNKTKLNEESWQQFSEKKKSVVILKKFLEVCFKKYFQFQLEKEKRPEC